MKSVELPTKKENGDNNIPTHSPPELKPQEKKFLEEQLARFNADRPKPEDFDDTYSSEVILEHQRKLKKLKKKIAKQESQNPTDPEGVFYGQILEMIVHDFGNAWFPGTFTRTSEYDDYVRKSDLVLEIQTDSGEILQIILDVTTSPQSALSKLEHIEERNFFFNDFPHSIKHFESDKNNVRGKLTAPRVIVGTTRDEVLGLGKLYAQYAQANHNHEYDIKKKVLNEITHHRFGQELKEEILIQLNGWLSVLGENVGLPQKTKKVMRHVVDELTKYKGSPISSSEEKKNRIVKTLENYFKKRKMFWETS
jgi:hypothetical protein